MLSVNKIQSNITYGSGMLYNYSSNTENSGFDKYSAYRKMNKDLYDADYVNGDISIWKFLSYKFKDLCDAFGNKNPYLEEKTKMIEQALLQEAQKSANSQQLDLAA
ncbi:MAG: hypothetical protein MJ180_03175 [Candidatus Gastranaerophilales bacterium]|nr:hypothetical protein [Candidatus Gastranaerophilales bacterium]